MLIFFLWKLRSYIPKKYINIIDYVLCIHVYFLSMLTAILFNNRHLLYRCSISNVVTFMQLYYFDWIHIPPELSIPYITDAV